MKSLLTMLIGLIPLFSFANLNELNIKLVDGRDIKVSLYDNPKLIFKSDQILLEFNNQTFEFPSNDIVGFNYYSVVNSVNDIRMDRQNDFIITNDGINVVKNNSNVMVYSLDGNLIMEKRVSGLLPYSDLPAGYSIITINNVSFKYLNQQR